MHRKVFHRLVVVDPELRVERRLDAHEPAGVQVSFVHQPADVQPGKGLRLQEVSACALRSISSDLPGTTWAEEFRRGYHKMDPQEEQIATASQVITPAVLRETA